jgi:polar amino acid transport system substrate-binding protein
MRPPKIVTCDRIVLKLMAMTGAVSLVFTGAVATATAATTPPGRPDATLTSAALKLVSPGTLTVLTTGGYAPMESLDSSTQKLVGFDPDIATALGQQLGLQVKFKNLQFAAEVPALQAGDGDVIISSLSLTKAREKVLSFVPYTQSGQEIIVPKGNPQGITAPAKLCGHNVGVAVGTQNVTLMDILNSSTCKQNPIKVKSYPDTTSAVLAVTDKVIDAAVDSYFSLGAAVQNDPSALQLGGPPFRPIVAGLATLPTNAGLHTALLNAMVKLRANGTVTKLLKKWNIPQDDIPNSYLTHPPAPSS